MPGPVTNSTGTSLHPFCPLTRYISAPFVSVCPVHACARFYLFTRCMPASLFSHLLGTLCTHLPGTCLHPFYPFARYMSAPFLSLYPVHVCTLCSHLPGTKPSPLYPFTRYMSARFLPIYPVRFCTLNRTFTGYKAAPFLSIYPAHACAFFPHLLGTCLSRALCTHLPGTCLHAFYPFSVYPVRACTLSGTFTRYLSAPFLPIYPVHV